jgi:putative transposase
LDQLANESIIKEKMERLEQGHYYHIYNRGAGKSTLYLESKDYNKFIEKYWYYMFFAVETYAWCIMQNHFHFLIKVRSLAEQEEIYQKCKESFSEGTFFGDAYDHTKPFDPGIQIRHLMNSYTKFFNKKYDMSGTLVEGTFKRKRITNENHFNHLICYIHRNPIHHGICSNFEDYPFSSYHDYSGSNVSYLNKKECIDSFGGLKNLFNAHTEFRLRLGEEFYLE